MLLRSSPGFLPGGFFVSGERIRFSCFLLAKGEEIGIFGVFSFIESNVLWAN